MEDRVTCFRNQDHDFGLIRDYAIQLGRGLSLKDVLNYVECKKCGYREINPEKFIEFAKKDRWWPWLKDCLKKLESKE